MPNIPTGFAYPEAGETLLLYVDDQYICNVCGNGFELEGTAHDHVRRAHPKEKREGLSPHKYRNLAQHLG